MSTKNLIGVVCLILLVISIIYPFVVWLLTPSLTGMQVFWGTSWIYIFDFFLVLGTFWGLDDYITI